MSSAIKAVVLAAGESSRFWPLASTHHKSLYRLMGKPVVQFTLEGLVRCGVTEIAVIISPGDNTVQRYFGDGQMIGARLSYWVQAEPKGMGDAVLQAAPWLAGSPFVVVNADQANADELLQPMLQKYSQFPGAMILSAQETETPWNYGILQLEGERAVKIVEKPAKGEEPSRMMVIGIYLMPPDFLPILQAQPAAHYNFETAIQLFMDVQHKTYAVIQPPETPEITLKFPWHLFRVNRYLMKRWLTQTYIDPTARISPLALIVDPVYIGANVRIFEHAVIKGPVYIEAEALVGNNSLVRDYSYVGQHTMVGFGTEIKNSILYDHVETHANYIGDSIVDAHCGFGAGTITANRRLDRANILSVVKEAKVDSGLSFFGMVTGQGVKTGIQAGIMPGVKIGSHCQIGPNVMVMKDLPDKHRCLNRHDQIIEALQS